MRQYHGKQTSAYLWKPHADSLAFLITTAWNLQEQCSAVMRVAEQRGLLQKMRVSMQIAAKALQGNGNWTFYKFGN